MPNITGPELAYSLSIEYEEERFQKELESIRDLNEKDPELSERKLTSCKEKHNETLNGINQVFYKISKR